jgi:N6-adenosine-specific RNA methylase IME4
MRIADIKIGERHRKDLGDIAALAASIAEIGLLHPVVVTPDGALIAGARRIAACVSLGWTDIPATVVDIPAIVRGEYAENTCRKDFAPSEAVAIWQAMETYRPGPKEDNPGMNHTITRRRERASEATGLGEQSLSRARQVMLAADAEPEKYTPLVEQMDRTGNVSRAYREVLRQRQAESPPVPTEKYRVIYADPAWSYENVMPEYVSDPSDHYALMSMAAVKDLPIKDLCEDNAVLFLWVPSPLIKDCFPIIDAWGFEYKAMFVWDKVKHNMGHYNSVRHELLLICVRGSCQPDVHKLFDSVVTEERTEHSRKPETFRQIIDTIYPNGRRIELFAREKHDNWDSWGNEV